VELIILPIEVSDSEKLRAIYCTPEAEPVTIKIDHAKDASSFSAIKRMYQELGVEDLEQSRIFKLGNIDKDMCFAVNISGLQHDSDLTRVPFYKVMQGEYSNSKLLAASFLTISYFA
jgi:hypothetical protein